MSRLPSAALTSRASKRRAESRQIRFLDVGEVRDMKDLAPGGVARHKSVT
jgi:hypothetical protein